MPISNMQQPMQMQPGMYDPNDPRQAYGLGGFIKKAFRGVKKIAKSPLGKLALGAAAGYGLNKFGPMGIKGFAGRFMDGSSGMMGGLSNIFRDKGVEADAVLPHLVKFCILFKYFTAVSKIGCPSTFV